MAFFSLLLVNIFIVILVVIFLLMYFSFIASFIIKIINRKKKKTSLKIASNIFLGLGCFWAIPIITLIIIIILPKKTKIELPDGTVQEAYVKDAEQILELSRDGSGEALEKLEKMLSKAPYLVYYYDINYNSVLDIGLEESNPDLIRLALSYGAVFDNPVKYEHMAYDHNSMEEFLRCHSKNITDKEVEVMKLLFDNGASAKCEICANKSYYSNILGESAWSFYYNDEVITDKEIEFLELIKSNGITEDPDFKYYEDCDFVMYGINTDIIKNDNYYKFIDIIGKAPVRE